MCAKTLRSRIEKAGQSMKEELIKKYCTFYVKLTELILLSRQYVLQVVL